MSDQLPWLNLAACHKLHSLWIASSRVPNRALDSQCPDAGSGDREYDVLSSHSSLNVHPTLPSCKDASLNAWFSPGALQHDIEAFSHSIFCNNLLSNCSSRINGIFALCRLGV